MEFSKEPLVQTDEQLKCLKTDYTEDAPGDVLACCEHDVDVQDIRCELHIAEESNLCELSHDKSLKPASYHDHDNRIKKVSYIDKRRERELLVSQIVELQRTLSDLSQKVDNIKLENLKLRSDNGVLVQCIKNFVYDFHMTQ